MIWRGPVLSTVSAVLQSPYGLADVTRGEQAWVAIAGADAGVGAGAGGRWQSSISTASAARAKAAAEMLDGRNIPSGDASPTPEPVLHWPMVVGT